MNVYFTDEERHKIRTGAERLGTTQAYVVRLIVRQAFGLPVGEKGEAELVFLSRRGLVDMSTI